MNAQGSYGVAATEPAAVHLWPASAVGKRPVRSRRRRAAAASAGVSAAPPSDSRGAVQA